MQDQQPPPTTVVASLNKPRSFSPETDDSQEQQIKSPIPKDNGYSEEMINI